MSHIEMLLIALLIDGIIGDPDWLWRRFPHPVAILGRIVSFLDERLNQGTFRRLKGIAALAFLLGVSGGVGILIQIVPDHGFLEILIGAILLAQNSLIRHVRDVENALEKGLLEARKAVAMIVGRDAANLTEVGIARASIESAAENFSDGVIAPAFWFLLFGAPGILVYKAVNTADSMIGYKTARHLEFGWASARLDDLMNIIPARLSGLLIAATSFHSAAIWIMRRDAPLHRSPNAGWPEAAMAGVLDVAIAGPRHYGGQLTDDPFVNDGGRHNLNAQDVKNATRVLWRSWMGFVVVLGFAYTANLF